MFDLIIKGGAILDGTGSEAVFADIGIKDGKIIAVAQGLQNAATIIDASGLMVTPGFIDSHSHADKKLLDYPEQREKLEQGVTTSVAGQCGDSIAPGLGNETYRTMGTFLDKVKAEQLGANFACFIGHGSVRRAVIGNENRAPTEYELEQMKVYLRDAFEHGAAGLSFGLFYAPGCYADKNEAVALAKVAREYNRPISAHIRSESDHLVEATQEFLEIVRESGCRGVLSHHKAVQRRNWGKVEQTLFMLEKAVDDGLDVFCDVYPYCASSTRFSQAFVPHTWRAGGTEELIKRIQDPVLSTENKTAFYEKHGTDFSWILINSCCAYPEFEGVTLDRVARDLYLDPYDAAMKLIVDCKDNCNACFFSVNEDDLKKVLAWDRTMICTDGGIGGTDKKHHPRMVGSFPRAIGVYARQHHVVALKEMIRKMTSMPAFVYGLNGKGLIKEGYDADICIFDGNKIIDQADFIRCNERAEGLNYVIVDGKIVAENAVFNGTMAGKMITI